MRSTAAYSADEMMTVTAARELRDRAVCFVGIGPPSEAANLAHLTHAPNLVLIYESGTIGANPKVLPLSIGDGELAETAVSVVSVPEIFSYWLQGGRIDVGFLSAAQIDKYANLNSTVIGAYQSPQVRLPGAGGAPEIAGAVGEVLVMLPHQRRTFVERVDFLTSVGFGRNGSGRPWRGGAGPAAVITNLGVLRPDQQTKELMLASIHPGVKLSKVLEETGWNLKFADELTVTPPPTDLELVTLRELRRRTRQAHRS